MPGTQRRPDPGVIERLRTTPWNFEFFQAVRVLANHFRHQTGESATQLVGERIRFGNSLNIGFAPSEIEALELETDPVTEAVTSAEATPPRLRHARLIPSFIGLTGNHGALPRSYTEQLIAREIGKRDRTTRAFLDIFSNRAVALFYRAWDKHRLYFQYERDRRERFLPMTLSLLGAGNPGMQEAILRPGRSLLAETLAYYAGALRQGAHPAHLIERVVADHFQVPVRLEQFSGRWHALPVAQQSVIGLANARLGVDTVCGERMWQCQTGITLEIGPLSRDDFERFLPGGEASRALSALLAALAGLTFDFTIRPVLRRRDVHPAQLGGPHAPRLGHNTWMLSRMPSHDRRDLSYEIRFDAASPSSTDTPNP